MIVTGRVLPPSRLLSLATLALVAASPGCLQQDTAGDTAKLDLNRQNTVADTLHAQYAKMKGQFSGSINASDVLLTLDVVRQNSTGNGDLGMVPQPTLTGTLLLRPRVFVTGAQHPADQTYPITGGQYVEGNDLTLTIQVNGSATTAHCGVTNQNTLSCSWYPGASTGTVTFTLNRIPNGAYRTDETKDLTGLYAGSNANAALIKAQFTSILEPQGGSIGMPVYAVAGNFCIAARKSAVPDGVDPGKLQDADINLPCHNFPFTDGQLDPITSTLAIKVPGTNPIVVNCTIKAETTVHCIWVGSNEPASVEEFDLNRIN